MKFPTIRLAAILWVTMVIVIATDQSDHYCPVSSAIDINGPDHYNFYPVDYAPIETLENEKKLSIKCSVRDTTCFPEDTIEHYCNYSCSTTKAFCPVHKTNVLETMPRNASALAKSALCVLKDKLGNTNEIIDVYFTGGSITAGAITQGCCSEPKCFIDLIYVPPCCWPFQLMRWMNATFPATIKYHNYAKGARETRGAVTFFQTQLPLLLKKKFTSNDIFFLDHSVNDNVFCLRGGKSTEVVYIVEELIRTLYSMSEPNDLPTIILLDADPRMHLRRANPAYAAAYNRVASYYNIPVWSYREAMISNYPLQHQSRYAKFLSFDMQRGTHPGWPVQLFMADLFASIIQHDLKYTCTEANVALQKNFRKRTMKDLPAPINPVVKFQCKNMLLRMSPDEMIERNEAVIGSYHSIPAGSWELRADVPGRASTAGFIRQLNATSTIEHDDHAKLVFTLNITTKELLDNKMNVSLQMYFGRSYDNGGLAQVSYCGKNITDKKDLFPGGLLDGRWEDKWYRYTLPFLWDPAPLSFSYCKGFKGKNPTIEITHQLVSFKKYHAVKQKFKVQNILACT